jgi:predicted ATPase
VGRDAELATLARALPTSAVISILGPGGVGKTRLAVAAAQAALPTFPGGVWIVEVGAERDEKHLPALVAAAVGLGSTPDLDTLLASLVASPALIILDSCEHLLEACRSLVSQIVRRCPDSRIITTSRQPLEFAGEVRLRLEPFTLSDAARLFVARAKDVRPEFDLDPRDEVYVNQICRRVDCLPLAIELAAMRLGFMSLHQLAEHGAQLGQPTDLNLRIARGFDLLSDEERRFSARLAILSGPFDDEAAGAVAGGEDAFGGSFELLTRLVEKSIVQVDLESGRYRMLTTIAEYLRSRLPEFDDPGMVRDAATKYYAGVVAALRLQRESEPTEAFSRYAAVRENVEAALIWALEESEDVELGAALAADMAPYWIETGRYADARRFLTAAIAQSASLSRRRILDALEAAVEIAAAGGDSERLEELAERLRVETGSSNDGAEVARVMLALALARQARSRYDEAASLFHHATNAFRIARDSRSLARALIGWSEIVVEQRGDVPQALSMLDEALEAARKGGSTSLVLTVVSEIAELWAQRGDESQAIEVIHDVAAACQELGDDASVGWTTLLLARAELHRDPIVGRMHARDALEKLRVHAHPGRLASAFELSASIAIDGNDDDTAARLLAFAGTLRHTHGAAGSLRERREIARLAEILERRMDRASHEHAVREGRAMSLDAATHRAVGDGKISVAAVSGPLIPA